MKSTTLTMIGAVMLGSTQLANAADLLPPIYDAPMYEIVPEIVPVEIGNGWYLRGDVSYDFDSDLDLDGDGSAEIGLDDGFGFGAGFGYRFTDFFRGDLTARYAKADLDFDDAFSPFSVGGDSKSWELMANAYVDLGTFVGVTPYVGGGLGAVRTDFNVNCSLAGFDCADFLDASESDTAEWRFAYALMAGVAYNLSENLALDVGYRFLDVDGGEFYGLSGDGFDFTLEDDGYQRHTIQAGLRYSLW
ncbi:outer membrane protein [Aurantimonas endophytica]|uniref:Opacity protein-like surface antigen n=1 Tax=Aurantimonas endophytica TaxID=1522175 RepID=A0A7W6HF13_9HYPH|nr:outer membrane protein [Aurantimonas endophytica]MBB4004030.1 opacity protein-like surface antigen [Aurantimonas endophytica]